jgi:branched-chain amino acid transport system substrate-binding protein
VQAIEAAQMMFDEVNAAGGIHGRKIKFVVEDHGYQVPKAQQNFNKLVNSDKVFAMILNLGTPMNIAGFQLMEPKKIANISPLTAARQMIEGDIAYKYTGTSSYYDQLRAGVEYLAKEKGAKEICAMYFPTDFGLEVYEGAKEEAAKLGLTFAAETQHKADEQDFVGSVTKLREAGCDIVATAVGRAPDHHHSWHRQEARLERRLLHRWVGRASTPLWPRCRKASPKATTLLPAGLTWKTISARCRS